jgi:hypothetical protein
MDALKPYLFWFKALALVAAIAGLIILGYNLNHKADVVQAAWDHAEAVAFKARGDRIEAARKAETALQVAADEDRRNHEKADDELRARIDVLAGELRKRPSRPVVQAGRADVHQQVAGPGPAGGCTGAGLYRDDAEFLAGKAALFESIRRQRDVCYIQYQRAQQALSKQGQGH